MMRSNWEHRRKKEVSNLIEMTSSTEEKFGESQAFMLGLRTKNNKGNQVLKFKNPLSSRWIDPHFGSITIEN